MSLFGGSKKVELLSPAQKQLHQALANQVIPQIGQGAEVYAGTLTPGFSPLQQQALGLAGQLPGYGQGLYMPALQQQLSGGGNYDEALQYYQDAVMPQARQDFADTMRGLESRYGNTYGASGALPEMAARAAGRFHTGLGAQLGGLAYQDRQGALNRQAQAIPMAMGAADQYGSQLGQMFGFGQQQRGLEAQQNQEAYQKWMAGQDYSNPWLNAAGMVLGTQTHGIGQETGILPGIGQFAGGLGQLAGAFLGP